MSERNGKAWVSITIQFAMMALVIGGGMWAVLIRPVNDKVNQSMQALSLAGEVSSDMKIVKDQNRTSIDERAEHAKKIEVLTQRITELERKEERHDNKEIEIETQFDSQAQSLSIQLAGVFRKLGEHQNALSNLGAKIPMAPEGLFFFPNISNRDGKQSK